MAAIRGFPAAVLFSVLLAAASTCGAQEHFGQDFKDLSPDLRDQKRQQYFSNLPETQQQRLRQHQQRFQSMPWNQQRALCLKFQEQNGYLPPACRGLLGP